MPRREDNLIPGGHKFTREEASKGGRKSAQVRKEKKTIKNLLIELLESDCKEIEQFKTIAKNMGLNDDDSIKKLFTVACIFNSLQKGGLDDLGKLESLLGENNSGYDPNGIEDDPLSKALMEEAKKMDEENSVESVENNEK